MLKKIRFITWVAALVSIGGVLYGYDIGVISGALLFIKNSIPMSDTKLSLIGGAVLGGGLIGTLLAGPLGDKFGRRLLITASSIILILGVSLVLLAKTFMTIFFARLFLGVGVGVVVVAVPLYVAEIVSSEERGKYVTFFQLFLTFGIVLAYVIDLFFTSSGNWRGMFSILLIPAVILLLGMLILPETPRWLVANKQKEKARQVLLKIRQGCSSIENDLSEIENGLNEVKGSWRELLSPQLMVPSLVAISVAILNQLTGINSFLQYAPLILKQAGISSNMVSMIGTVGIGVLNFLFTIIAITMIDSIGRRPLLLIGTAGVAASELFLGIVHHSILNMAHAGILSLIGLLFFTIFFAIGPGVVVWLVISELFPTRVRGKGIALCLFLNSLASTLLAGFFLPLVARIGMDQTYWLFAFFSFGYFLMVYFYLPETKSKSLEEIQEAFANATPVFGKRLLPIKKFS